MRLQKSNIANHIRDVDYSLRFFLKDPLSSCETSVLYSLSVNQLRIRGSLSFKIYPIDWDQTKQEAVHRKKRPELKQINRQLQHFKKYVFSIIESNNFSFNELKNNIKSYNQSVKPSSFWELFNLFIEYKKIEGKSTLKDYDQTLRRHLEQFELKNGVQVSLDFFKNSNLEFYNLLRDFLKNHTYNHKSGVGLSINSIGKQIKNLRVFLNWCFDQQRSERFSTKHLQIEKEYKESVYLTEEELIKLVELPLTGKEKIYRDLFLIGCETGMRFSDFTSLNEVIIDETSLLVNPKKTRTSLKNNHLVIPISTRLNTILKQYKELPTLKPSKLNEFNVSIKAICFKAGITNEVEQHTQEGGALTKVTFKKYELISSHTCRRTFCTLKFLAGMPSHAIMKFSGHTTEANFLRYLKLDNKITAEKYRDFF